MTYEDFEIATIDAARQILKAYDIHQVYIDPGIIRSYYTSDAVHIDQCVDSLVDATLYMKETFE